MIWLVAKTNRWATLRQAESVWERKGVKVADCYWVNTLSTGFSFGCGFNAKKFRDAVFSSSLCTKSINCFNSTQLDHSSFFHFVSTPFLLFSTSSSSFSVTSFSVPPTLPLFWCGRRLRFYAIWALHLSFSDGGGDGNAADSLSHSAANWCRSRFSFTFSCISLLDSYLNIFVYCCQVNWN